MSCAKISVLLSLHWRHSAQCDCLGSCWKAVSLNEDCKHTGESAQTWPCALKGLSKHRHWLMIPTSVRKVLARNSVTYDFGAVDATHHGISWQHVGKCGKDYGEGFGCFKLQICGLLWSSLAETGQRPAKWSISGLWSPIDTHTHPPTHREVWPAILNCGLPNSGQNGAFWVTVNHSPEGLSLGIIVDHLQLSTPPPLLTPWPNSNGNS